MQHEGIGVAAQLGHDERHTLSHQSGDKGDVARKAVQVRNDYAALVTLCGGQRRGQLGPPFQGVSTLSGLGLDVLGDDLKPFGFGKSSDGGALRFDSETRALLPLRRNSQICDGPFHVQTGYHRLRFVRTHYQSNDVAVCEQ
jgi:hypothetical protein